MNSVAPAAAEQQPIFCIEAERTPLEGAVASEYGEGFASEGFFVVPSQLTGFVQTGAPAGESGTGWDSALRLRRCWPCCSIHLPKP